MFNSNYRYNFETFVIRVDLAHAGFFTAEVKAFNKALSELK